MSEQPSILPPNSTSLERSLERLIQSTRPDLSPVATLMNPDTCPADLLGWLAWAFSVDVWEPSWDEATKRRVIKAALEVHRRKGTVTALRRVLEGIVGQISIAEPRNDPRLAPHAFALSLAPNQGLQAASYAELIHVVESVKPVRSRLSAIRVTRSAVTTFYKATALHSGTHLRVGIRFGLKVAPTHRTIGAALHQVKRTEIRPARPSIAVAPARLMRGTAAHITAKTTIQPRSI
ncbi:phage tail protein I [Phaeobacter sp. JH204B]|uniref:phage tail protein I n=1 Tax=Phaeobacter sp. JH204B TaxID=3112503 RepID=UPI003A83BA01